MRTQRLWWGGSGDGCLLVGGRLPLRNRATVATRVERYVTLQSYGYSAMLKADNVLLCRIFGKVGGTRTERLRYLSFNRYRTIL